MTTQFEIRQKEEKRKLLKIQTLPLFLKVFAIPTYQITTLGSLGQKEGEDSKEITVVGLSHCAVSRTP